MWPIKEKENSSQILSPYADRYGSLIKINPSGTERPAANNAQRKLKRPCWLLLAIPRKPLSVFQVDKLFR